MDAYIRLYWSIGLGGIDGPETIGAVLGNIVWLSPPKWVIYKYKNGRANMTPLILCVATAMNIFSMPAGNTVVGTTTLGEQVQLQDGSLMRDWVFIGTPGWDESNKYLGVRSRGWVPYANLTCNQ